MSAVGSETSTDGEQCPTCGDTFDTWNGVKIHHALAHDESIKGVEVNCSWCGGTLRRKEYLAEKCDHHFCTDDCEGSWRSENMAGEDHPNYKKVEVACEQCGDNFKIPPSRVKKDGVGKFCSRECKDKRLSEKSSGENNPLWKEKHTNTCEWCGCEYEVLPSQAKRTRFCSHECLGSSNGTQKTSEKVNIICETCGDEFQVVPSRRDEARFCSRACVGSWVSENQSGQDHPNWRGGKSVYDAVKKQLSPTFHSVKDDYRKDWCELCGESDCKLDVHHIIPIMVGGTNEKWNMMTLCNSCHHKAEWHTRRFTDPVLVE